MKQKRSIVINDDRNAIDVLRIDIATQKKLDRVVCIKNTLKALEKIPDHTVVPVITCADLTGPRQTVSVEGYIPASIIQWINAIK